jgi:hypothetical protein
VAAVGVFGVFQMALYVAEHSGRSASETVYAACALLSLTLTQQLLCRDTQFDIACTIDTAQVHDPKAASIGTPSRGGAT